jgi:transcriptional regulator with XRE-family HTH domain
VDEPIGAMTGMLVVDNSTTGSQRQMSNDTGERVRALRTARGIAQADLAATLGVSKSYLSHIEAGRRPLTGELVRRVAAALQVDEEQLQSGVPAGVNEEIELKLAFAELSLRNGAWDLAANEFAEAEERARALPFGRYLDEATWGKARADEASGRLEEAIVSYQELLARPELSSAVPRARVSADLVLAYLETGDLARAIDVGEQALGAMDRLEVAPDVSVQVELIGTLAGCYLERGDLTSAHLLAQRAIALSEQDGAIRARAAAAWNAANVADRRRDAVAARESANRALALYSEMDNARALGLLRVVSAAIYLSQERPDGDAALPQLAQALVELRDVGSRVDLGYVRTEQARALLVTGDLDGAHEAGLRALEELGDASRLETGRTMLVLGHVAVARGETDAAVDLLRQAAMALEESGSRQAGTVWRELGEAYIRLGRSEEAIDALRRASDLAGATYNPMRAGLTAAGRAFGG